MLTDAVVQHRIRLNTQIIRLLVTIIAQPRSYKIKADGFLYQSKIESTASFSRNDLPNL